jgi:hypothetical protein
MLRFSGRNAGGNRAAAKKLWFQIRRDRRLRFTALFADICARQGLKEVPHFRTDVSHILFDTEFLVTIAEPLSYQTIGQVARLIDGFREVRFFPSLACDLRSRVRLPMK